MDAPFLAGQEPEVAFGYLIITTPALCGMRLLPFSGVLKKKIAVPILPQAIPIKSDMSYISYRPTRRSPFWLPRLYKKN